MRASLVLVLAATAAVSACGPRDAPNLCGANWCDFTPTTTTANLNAVWGSSDRDVWMVGDAGTMLHWNGLALSAAASNTTIDLHGVWGSGADDVWIVGRPATGSTGPNILHWDGAAWTGVAGTENLGLNCVWGASASDVWAGGDAGVLVHWNGTAWAPIPLGAQQFVDAIWGTSANDVTAVGGAGLIQHWDGTAWSAAAAVGTGPMTPLHAVWGAGGDGNVWAVGDDFNGGGVTFLRGPKHQDWASIPTVGDSALFGIWGINATSVWAVGGYGKIFHFDGTRWSRQVDTPATFFAAVWGTSIAVWAVGSMGAVFHTVDLGTGVP